MAVQLAQRNSKFKVSKATVKLVEKTLDVEGSLISTDRPWCRICSKTWRSICSCSTCDIYQDLEGIISGYKKFISVLIPALKGCEASRWKANTDRSTTS